MNMNHHLPAMPHGQPPMPPRRQQDLPYATGPPNMRSPPAYMGYHHLHMNGHPPPPYSPHQYPQWYPAYPQMQMPPRPYQPPYAAPMIVSSYPPTQPIMAPAHIPPPALHLQPRTSTPLQPAMSPVGPAPPLMDMQEQPPVAVAPVNPSPAPPVSSPPPTQGGIKGLPYFPPLPGPFRAPVCAVKSCLFSRQLRFLTNIRFPGFLSPKSRFRPGPRANAGQEPARCSLLRLSFLLKVTRWRNRMCLNV